MDSLGGSMPYITKTDRRRIDGEWTIPETAGELNYFFTSMIKKYIGLKGESYQTYNDVLGCLEGCKLELYRRKVSPYEDTKIKSNGDVF